MKIIGKNRFEAIDWVQDRLGPNTPRNVAEDTLGVLLREGYVEDDIDELVLIEEIEQTELRDKARDTMVRNDLKRMRTSSVIRGPHRRGGPSTMKNGRRFERGERRHTTHTDGEFAHRDRSRHRTVHMQQLVDDTQGDADAVAEPIIPTPSPPKRRK